MRLQPRPLAGSPRRTDKPLAELAGLQHGVVSGRQLRQRLGYSETAITRAADAGRLHRLHRDVYAVGHTNLSDQGRHLAAVLACGPGALLSHRSAGWLWGILSKPSQIEVTGPERRRPRGSIRLHHSQVLIEDDRAIRDRIPVTALPRTLLDLAAVLTPRGLERAIEHSERLDLFDLVPVEELLSRVKRHHGVRRLRRAVALYRHDPAFTREEFERRFLRLLRESSLPQPSVNFFTEGYELDVYWPHERFAIELDSFEFHGTRRAFERDHRRLEDLKVAGIEVVPVTWRRLNEDPQELLERISTLLADRSAHGSGRG